ncbi:imidazole glycerol phosphate synthase subunit HisH [Anaerofilum sp. BX8]|uniref:Imidazole glycerol phosphate synthase subunit HisH n=1 Tax=Anaerofilum hominis TaxID=2763016 RepID=A0A923I6K2_9FIRM|nr:imidazole glycerol phosphate synthase subunit HisH [Anaerofilum hominis]MBC5580759.1 imidazole glycerol phosphate synthase subunit HisH [Anaerofilum hominis]
MKRVTLIDYGLSNLLSVQRAFEHFGAKVEIARSPAAVLGAQALVLPGVGAFRDGMAGLEQLGLTVPIRQKAAAGTPLLGICLGMQMLFDESEEFGRWQGLGLIPGRVVKLPERNAAGGLQRVPQVGWNGLLPPQGKTDFADSLLRAVRPGGEVYFVHSYEAKPARPQDRLAEVLYGGRRVCAAARSGSVTGCQFHPEKSGEVGLSIIRQFLEDGEG